LLGLGLQGHLSALSVTDLCDYLTQGHEPTTLSVLIGAAASKYRIPYRITWELVSVA